MCWNPMQTRKWHNKNYIQNDWHHKRLCTMVKLIRLLKHLWIFLQYKDNNPNVKIYKDNNTNVTYSNVNFTLSLHKSITLGFKKAKLTETICPHSGTTDTLRELLWCSVPDDVPVCLHPSWEKPGKYHRSDLKLAELYISLIYSSFHFFFLSALNKIMKTKWQVVIKMSLVLILNDWIMYDWGV